MSATSDQPAEEDGLAADLPSRDGRCQWCNGPHEGGKTVSTARSYWWHTDCAEDNQRELEEALG